MPANQSSDVLRRAHQALACAWNGVLDLCLVAWVARASVGLLAVGFMILTLAPQAQDLLIPLVDSSYYRFGLFFPLVFLLWAMPTHYAARLAVDDDERLAQYRAQRNSKWLDFLIRHGPRVLGALTFIAFLICAYRGRIDFPVVVSEDENVRAKIFTELSWFMFWCLVWSVIFLLYAATRNSLLAGSWPARQGEAAAAKLAPVLDRLDIAPHRSTMLTRPQSYLGRTILFAYFWAFVAVMLASPLLIAEWLPRAWAVALVLGGWLPVLAWLSAIGRRLRAPLIFATFGALSILVLIVGDNHRVRLSAPDAGANTLTPLDAALTGWMQANDCAPGTGKACHRPVIVVAAGGASRAGFFTASVIGELLDKAASHGLDAATVRNRLFAISSVSGGSLAAVMSVAALARGGVEGEATHRVPLWYGDEVKNWRGCLEAMMSGDFLTPTFIGLSFHDMIPLRLWSDRAKLLEVSWERYVRSVMGEPVASKNCPFDLECPFLGLHGNDKLWLPLLILNGTSVSNGQRILTTSLAPTYRLPDGLTCPVDMVQDGCPIFPQTYLFHRLINPSADAGAAAIPAIAVDVRLSTAATNSARFPFISPAGEIVPPGRSQPVDRIVDGGYLENFGALSAFDLVNAMRALRPELKPFVLVISNDPNEPVDPQAPPATVGAKYLSDITSFIWGVATTRDSRAAIGLVHLKSSVGAGNGRCAPSMEHIRVWPIARSQGSSCTHGTEGRAAISMSWWSSKPVQLRLVAELDRRSCNRDGFEAIWKALSESGSCAAP
jgi:hypothetical protein